MATTLSKTEALPATYPPAPPGLSTAAAALAPALIWQRIEPYISHRWTPRNVAWIVEGPGEWHPTLTPATIATQEIWSGADEWETADLSPSALGGYFLPAIGPYRFSGTAGAAATVPDIVNEAYRRLAEYIAQKPTRAGTTSERIASGSVSLSVSRSASWASAALANSGAADMLRSYRRV